MAVPKWDGFRCLVFRDGDKVELQSKSGQSLTRYFPEIVEAVSALQGGPHILDGEGVVVDERGRSSFDRFQDRALPRRPPPPGADRVLFMVFDILMLDGQALIDEPVERRKDLLQQLLGEASRLGNLIDEHDSGSRSVMQQLEAVWSVARPQVERTKPQLVDQFDANVEMCRKAVDGNRPADADKAFRNLSTLVTSYLSAT